MSVVERIMELSDQTFASRDVLALLAYVYDMRGVSGAEFANAAASLGLAETVDFDPELHADQPALPGDRLTFYGDTLKAAVGIGRQRLAERFPKLAH